MDWETIETWVEQYGYLAVALGTLADQSGLQSFVVAGGVVAGIQEHITLTGVILAGAAGSFTSDMIMFALGRWRAGWLERIVRSPKGKARLDLMQLGMNRWALPLMALGRFLPWIGRFVPAAAGLRRVRAWRVVAGAGLGSLLSATGYAYLGYAAAATVEWLEAYALFFWLGALLISIPAARYLLRGFDRKVERMLADRLDKEARQRDPAA